VRFPFLGSRLTVHPSYSTSASGSAGAPSDGFPSLGAASTSALARVPPVMIIRLSDLTATVETIGDHIDHSLQGRGNELRLFPTHRC